MQTSLRIADRNRRLEEIVKYISFQDIEVFCLKLYEVYLYPSEILTIIKFSKALSHDFVQILLIRQKNFRVINEQKGLELRDICKQFKKINVDLLVI